MYVYLCCADQTKKKQISFLECIKIYSCHSLKLQGVRGVGYVHKLYRV